MNKLISIALISAALITSAFSEEIGKVTTKGWLFKDSIVISAFDDPDYPEIACYVTSADRSLTWENPSDSSIACRLIGDAPKNIESQSREDVFSQSLNPFFKVSKVDRFYDATRNVMVYISYVRATSGDNHAHAISVVPLGSKL